ncbi:unnamed protein product [Rhizoctonia solani]|uniref:Transmembrane protein n=1 Tax=Rhizoctonia solani TaxID=456999 RepID=A0A8H3ASJ5_9AGAM|nr:unnamed protein product [Rhizoctonia solani]
MMMMMPVVSFFVLAFLVFSPTINAYPAGLNPRQGGLIRYSKAGDLCDYMHRYSTGRAIGPVMSPSIRGLSYENVHGIRIRYSRSIYLPVLRGKWAKELYILRMASQLLTSRLYLWSGLVPTTTDVPLSAAPSTVIVTEFVTISDTPRTATAAETTSTVTVAPTPTATPPVLSIDSATATFTSATAAISTSSIVIESTSSSTNLRSPAAISVYVIISIIIILLILLFIRRWHRARQHDYIIPSHRRTRGKSFLIDESSLKRRSFNSAIDLTTKPAPVYSLSFKGEQPLPAVPIPAKDSSDPSAGIALSYIPQLASTRTTTRNYTALPGRSPSPVTSPEPEKTFVTQTFAAGRERAITNIRHSREGSRSPTSPSSSISGPSSPNGDMYASTTQSPLPAYAYMAPHQPAAPSPLRAQLRTKPGPSRVSTIQEEPRTPHGAQSVFSMATTMSPPMSVLNSKVETAQRLRPTFASHVRNPGSAERMHQFAFPNPRQSLKEAEFQITISEAMIDGVPVSRSQTPNGSMHRGAGGSVSSMSKVQGKLQALVDGIRRERD